MSEALRIAMWSGPRNISTAMMRAFGQRPDCAVTDEPLYAFYLEATGLEHPMREAVIAHHESDWRKVAEWLTGPVPDGKPVWYQKHMAHHLLPEVERGWLGRLTHAFLIREPAEMLASLEAKLGPPRLEDTGLPQQVELFRRVRAETGRVPPVVDARDVRTDPRRTLTLLCEALGLPFTETMLSWPPGRRATDGVWAEHWYDAVERSTGFAPWRETRTEVPERLAGLLAECRPLHAELWAERLR